MSELQHDDININNASFDLDLIGINPSNNNLNLNTTVVAGIPPNIGNNKYMSMTGMNIIMIVCIVV